MASIPNEERHPTSELLLHLRRPAIAVVVPHHHEVEKSFTFWGTPEGDAVHPAECMHQLLEQVRRHKVNIDGNVCTVMVTTLVLEGWQRKLDPGYNVMQALKTLLFKADWVRSLSYTIEALMSA